MTDDYDPQADSIGSTEVAWAAMREKLRAQPRTRIICAHVMDGLRQLDDESVHCVVTSPPYYGLRSYGTEPQVWGGDPICQHEWGAEWIAREDSGRSRLQWGTGGDPAAKIIGGPVSQGAFCQCGAWRGALGLEPTPELFIQHLVEVFREVRRVLRKDGTLWLNIGDSYATSNPAGRRDSGDGTSAKFGDHGIAGSFGPSTRRNVNCKPKDLLMIPAQLALALRNDGAASPQHMRDIERMMRAVYASYPDPSDWPGPIAAEMERLQREHIDANKGGWYLRSEIVWAKRAPMPESVTDRPTCAHEKIYLLSKSKTYYYDAEAVKEEAEGEPEGSQHHHSLPGTKDYHVNRTKDFQSYRPSKRNMRNVWTLGPSPFPEAHFATYPPEIPRRAILAGTAARGVCPKCGRPWVRQISMPVRWTTETETIGWRPSCSCEPEIERQVLPGGGVRMLGRSEPIPATILDPFLGSGTTALIADQLGRHCIGLELNPQYAAMAERRIRDDAGLFAQVAQ
jgi:DNA modification methylase